MTHPAAFVATIALCGGTSRRMSVPDKTALPFGEGTILDSALTGLPPGLLVCVGDPRPLRASDPGHPSPDETHVVWTREHPVGGGPVAGIRAGLDAVLAELDDTTVLDRREALVAVIAGDQPFAGRVVPHLVEAMTRALDHATTLDGIPDAAAVPSPGRDAPALLLAVYRLRALDAAIAADAEDRGVYQTLRGLKVITAEVPFGDTGHLALDIDDPDDLARAVALEGRLT